MRSIYPVVQDMEGEQVSNLILGNLDACFFSSSNLYLTTNKLSEGVDLQIRFWVKHQLICLYRRKLVVILNLE